MIWPLTLFISIFTDVTVYEGRYNVGFGYAAGFITGILLSHPMVLVAYTFALGPLHLLERLISILVGVIYGSIAYLFDHQDKFAKNEKKRPKGYKWGYVFAISFVLLSTFDFLSYLWDSNIVMAILSILPITFGVCALIRRYKICYLAVVIYLLLLLVKSVVVMVSGFLAKVDILSMVSEAVLIPLAVGSLRYFSNRKHMFNWVRIPEKLENNDETHKLVKS